jgi:hypothetical protein
MNVPMDENGLRAIERVDKLRLSIDEATKNFGAVFITYHQNCASITHSMTRLSQNSQVFRSVALQIIAILSSLFLSSLLV